MSRSNFYNILKLLNGIDYLALIKLSGVREEHAHIQLDIIIRSKNSIPQSPPAVSEPSGKTTGNEIATKRKIVTIVVV